MLPSEARKFVGVATPNDYLAVRHRFPDDLSRTETNDSTILRSEEASGESDNPGDARNKQVLNDLIHEAEMVPAGDTERIRTVLERARMVLRNIFPDGRHESKLSNCRFDSNARQRLDRLSVMPPAWEADRQTFFNSKGSNRRVDSLWITAQTGASAVPLDDDGAPSNRVFIVHGHDGEIEGGAHARLSDSHGTRDPARAS